MASLIKHVNEFSGLWVLVSIVVAIVIFFVRIETNQQQLNASTHEIKQSSVDERLMLREISDQLKDKDRDHEQFARQQDQTVVVLDRLSRVMIKLELTIDGLNDK
jgi:hypothetical protein